MDRHFNLAEAQRELDEITPQVDELVGLRADLVEAAHAHRSGDDEVAIADLKGMEARLSEIVDEFKARGIQVKGWAPLLLDFPMAIGDRQILLCWLEGEGDLSWYHDEAHGCAGRRPLSTLDA